MLKKHKALFERVIQEGYYKPKDLGETKTTSPFMCRAIAKANDDLYLTHKNAKKAIKDIEEYLQQGEYQFVTLYHRIKIVHGIDLLDVEEQAIFNFWLSGGDLTQLAK